MLWFNNLSALEVIDRGFFLVRCDATNACGALGNKFCLGNLIDT